MVANKPGNLDGETAGSTVWTPPNELVVAAARARDAVAPSAERSALLKEKERQRSKRRRENATAEQRAKERARSARRRNALTPEEKQAQALKRAERRKERKANGMLPAPKRAHRALASPEQPLALRRARDGADARAAAGAVARAEFSAALRRLEPVLRAVFAPRAGPDRRRVEQGHQSRESPLLTT